MYANVIYTDGSAIPAIGTRSKYSAACSAVSGRFDHTNKFEPVDTKTKHLGDVSAQSAELQGLLLALQQTIPTEPTLIVSDSEYVVRAFNLDLIWWVKNDFKDSRNKPIASKQLWQQVMRLKENNKLLWVTHTRAHKSDHVHSIGNALADLSAREKSTKLVVAALTRSATRIDEEIQACLTGGPYPRGYPQSYLYSSEDNVVTVKIPVKNGTSLQRVIPNLSERSKIIAAAHSGLSSTHFGVTATTQLLQERYWWPELRKQVKIYIANCSTCLQTTVDHTRKPKETPLPLANKPFECMFLDHIGPLTPVNKFKYILIIVDSCTKFTWMYPQRNADCKTVIKDLHLLLAVTAVQVFYADNGPAFAGKALKEALSSVGTRLCFSNPFRPQANGVVERAIGVIKQALAKCLLAEGGNWLKHVPLVMRSINNLPRQSLCNGKSPHEMLFGTRMFMSDLHNPPSPSTRPDQLLLTSLLRDSLQEKAVQEKAEIPSEGVTLKAGDWVLEKIHDRTSLGPYYRPAVQVIEVLGSRTVVIPALPPKKGTRQVSIDHLKPAPKGYGNVSEGISNVN